METPIIFGLFILACVANVLLAVIFGTAESDEAYRRRLRQAIADKVAKEAGR